MNQHLFSIELKALILAILIHLIIAYVFIFSIPIKPAANRPDFIFWGSFLGPFVSDSSIINDRTLVEVQVPTNNYPSHAFNPKLMPKPDAKQKNTQNKKFIKTTFLEEKNKNDTRAPSILNQTKASFQPLKPELTIP